mgnify:CR=1 FL=1
MWIGIIAVLVVGFVGVNRLFLVPNLSPMPDDLGWQDGQFTRCAKPMNCVSSTDPEDSRTYIAPISYTGSVQDAHDTINRILGGMERMTPVTDTENYIHVEFRSLMNGFIDDTEFYIDADNNLIHVKSSARLGESDMGVNRNRIESIREQFNAAS